MSRTDFWSRRQWLRAGTAAALLARSRSAAAADGVRTVRFAVEETAGLRRFSYPVHTVIPGLAPASGENFRLLKQGRAVPAQFRSVAGRDGKPAVALDFNASPGPLESEPYVIELGTGVEAGPEPKRGIGVEQADGKFRIRSGGALTYVLANPWRGFLQSVGNGGREYLVPGAADFFVQRAGDAGQRGTPLTGKFAPEEPRLQGTIVRQGPLSIGLRYEGLTPLGPETPAAATTIDMTFPSSKSWVETTWRIDDPTGAISGLEVELRLALEGETVLVDYGTAATVYGVLRGRERMTLTAGTAPGLAAAARPWRVEKGPPEGMTLFAEAVTPDGPPAEGWAHAMDASRCTAVAVAGFGQGAEDQIAIETGGLLRIRRTFAGGSAAAPPGPRMLTFWLHFVPMPVQVGAATSPQAMLAPLRVRWNDSRP